MRSGGTIVTGSLHNRIEIPAARAIMRPVAASRPGVKIKRAGMFENITRRRGISDDAGDIRVSIRITEIKASGVAMPRCEGTAPEIEASLKAEKLASGTWRGKGPVAVVDALAKHPHTMWTDAGRQRRNRSAGAALISAYPPRRLSLHRVGPHPAMYRRCDRAAYQEWSGPTPARWGCTAP